MRSDTIAKLAEALAKAQGQIAAAEKNSQNPHFKNRYADLAAVIEVIREPLSKNGLSYVQFVRDEDDGNYLVTLLMHSSGEWIEERMILLYGKNDMQGLGGAVTYARRYSISSLLGVAQEDDDGNTASAGGESTAQQQGQQARGVGESGFISKAQADRLWAIRKAANWTPADVTEYMVKNFKVDSLNTLPWHFYKDFCNYILKNPKQPPPAPSPNIQANTAPDIEADFAPGPDFP